MSRSNLNSTMASNTSMTMMSSSPAETSRVKVAIRCRPPFQDEVCDILFFYEENAMI